MASVADRHPQYLKTQDSWKKCRDVAAGTKAVRAAREEYLPKLSLEEEEDYEARVNRTTLFNAFYRTLLGYQGLLFRKPAAVTIPERFKPLLEDVSLDGTPLTVFADKVTEEVLEVGRVGILVNYPETNARTLAEEKLLGLRPAMHTYKTEQIYNWREAMVGNRKIYTQIRLEEQATVIKSEFDSESKTQYRILDLDASGNYRVRIFEQHEGKDVLIGEPYYPKMNGKNLKRIPFFVISTEDFSICPEEPPLIDLVDVNIAHYQVSADYESGCHWSGNPTLVITGHKVDPAVGVTVGPRTYINCPEPEAKVQLVEAGKEGFAALEKNLDRKEKQMVILGARLLEVQKPGIEAAETALIHRAGEQSILSRIAQNLSIGITQPLRLLVEWAGGTEVSYTEVWYELNRDFFHTPLDPTKITAIVSAWQAGAISSRTRFNMLKQGEVYLPGDSFEEEEQRIREESPVEVKEPKKDPVKEEGAQ